MFNLIIKQLYNFNPIYFDPRYSYFFCNFQSLNENVFKDKFSLLKKFKYLKVDTTLHVEIDKIFYDIYSQRYIIIQTYSSFLISQKNNIADIFICSREHNKYSTVLYLNSLNKNILAFQSDYDIRFMDIEDGKLIYSFSYDEEEKIRNIKLLDNQYLVIHKKKIIEFFKITQKESEGLIKFNLNKIFTKSNVDAEIFEIHSMLVLNKIDKLMFAKINKKEKNLYEIFSLKINNNLKSNNIDIIDINKDRILIKYFTGNNFVYKFEIYNLKTRQLISVYNIISEIQDILFDGRKYLIGVKNYNNEFYDLNNFKKKNYNNSLHIPLKYKDWGVYSNNSGESFLIANQYYCKIDNKSQGAKRIDFTFPSGIR